MKDTSAAIERKFRRMLMERSGAERLKMGCSMHATAQALAKASLLRRYPGAHPGQLRRLLFLHFYVTDFEPEERRRIASALARRTRPGKALEEIRPTARRPLDRTELAIIRDRAETYEKKRSEKSKRPRQHRT